MRTPGRSSIESMLFAVPMVRSQRVLTCRSAAVLGCLISALALAGCSPRPVAPERPQGLLDLDGARRYVLALVNADRQTLGLAALERDAVAEQAGQEHAEDMAHLGYTAHWGSDGSVPEERYTRAGGVHFVQENAACFFDADRRPLDREPRFEPAALEQIEAAFMGEVPPHDGHRTNILKTTHTGLGIGLAQPEGLRQPCMAQEFVDVHGEYEALPRKARLGQSVRIAGELSSLFGGRRIDLAKPAQLHWAIRDRVLAEARVLYGAR